ncbi:MAG: Zinc-type alcohol dehydrogenase-like protein [Chlamydiales bacterium]|nr:Zinc-type alcohol dehydrogenase-like protein [Chlamydiales bacterium]MCH9635200.1 Zinc-type alcohol dehydrogenase-like protein [Chlamydiales bacterium]MCH9703976.1 NADP-dependent oxidoreductase [Chlamydiota bacterium]
MKAIVIHDFTGIDAVKLTDIPTPKPQGSEVQIQIKAAGVNPVDWKIADGLFRQRMDYELPVTLGWDCSGVISDPGSSNFKKGDEVYAYCLKDRVHDGTYAEYICIESDKVSKKPSNLSFEQAATIPLASLTAWQSLVDAAKIQSGQKLLIHGGAGGVGGFAIQIAKHFGCYVVTTASKKNHAYCELLGADEIIDYTEQSVKEYILSHHPDKMDMVYNTLGESEQLNSVLMTKEGGCVVAIAAGVNEEQAARHKVRAVHVFVQPNREQLEKISGLIEDGEIAAPTIFESFPLEKAEEALMLSRKRHVQGKLVLTL